MSANVTSVAAASFHVDWTPIQLATTEKKTARTTATTAVVLSWRPTPRL